MNDRYEMFTILVNRISRNIRKIKNNEMAEYGLRSSHISCLYYLYSENNLTASELCERCEEDKATISRSLGYLEKSGYLSYRSKNAKRYKDPLILTDLGIETAKNISAKINNVLEEIQVFSSEEERASFFSRLSTISDRLEMIANKSEL